MPVFTLKEITDIAVKNRAEYGTEAVVNATKYRNYGSRSEGVASLLDKDIVQANAEQRRRKFGTATTRVVAVGPDNKPDFNATMNVDGRIHTPGADGTFRMIDEDFIDDIIEQQEERSEYVNKMLKAAVVSNETCAYILGMELEDMKNNYFAEGKPDTATMAAMNMPIQISKYCCDIDLLQCYGEHSKEFALGLAKLRCIVGALLPITSRMTKKSTTGDPVNLEKVVAPSKKAKV